MNYYIISGSDGNVHISRYLEKQSVIDAITGDEHGDSEYGDVSKLKFKGGLKNIQNLDAHELIILEGRVILPRPKRVVETYEID